MNKYRMSALLTILICSHAAQQIQISFDQLAPGQLPEIVDEDQIAQTAQQYMQTMSDLPYNIAHDMAAAVLLIPQAPHQYEHTVLAQLLHGQSLQHAVRISMGQNLLHPYHASPSFAPAARNRIARAWQYACPTDMPVAFWIDLHTIIIHDDAHGNLPPAYAIFIALMQHAASVVPGFNQEDAEQRTLFIERCSMIAPGHFPQLWTLANQSLQQHIAPHDSLIDAWLAIQAEFEPEDNQDGVDEIDSDAQDTDDDPSL
jgi:hypothetical protein